MTACRACGASLCDCPDLAFAGLMPAETHRAAVPDFSDPSGRTVGAAGHGLNDRPGCISDHSFHNGSDT